MFLLKKALESLNRLVLQEVIGIPEVKENNSCEYVNNKNFEIFFLFFQINFIKFLTFMREKSPAESKGI